MERGVEERLGKEKATVFSSGLQGSKHKNPWNRNAIEVRNGMTQKGEVRNPAAVRKRDG